MFQTGWDLRIPGADDDSVTNVRFPRAGTKIAAIKLRGRALNNVLRVNSQVAG